MSADVQTNGTTRGYDDTCHNHLENTQLADSTHERAAARRTRLPFIPSIKIR